MLPYNGEQGNKLLSKMKKYLNKSLPTEVKITVTYERKKLGTKFKLRDKTKFHQQKNLVYYSKCPDETCNEDYIRETDRRIIDLNICICKNNPPRRTMNIGGTIASRFWEIITAQISQRKLLKLFV